MTISSRTPEGTPNRCPLCGQAVCIEPSQPFGDAPCPACGSLLWFVTTDAGQRFFDPEAGDLLERLAERLGVDPQALREKGPDGIGVDSLDLAEVIMELEEEMGDDLSG